MHFSSMRSMKFQVSSLNTCWVILRTKFKNEHEQRAITPKVWSFELWFLCNALLLNEVYLPMKFHVDALHSFKVMLRTKKGINGRAVWLTDWLTDGRVDYYMPPFGGIKCCTQCRQFKLMGTMTKWPLQKQTHGTAQNTQNNMTLQTFRINYCVCFKLFSIFL